MGQHLIRKYLIITAVILKKDILENYFANFCPENDIYPGGILKKL